MSAAIRDPVKCESLQMITRKKKNYLPLQNTGHGNEWQRRGTPFEPDPEVGLKAGLGHCRETALTEAGQKLMEVDKAA